MTETHEQRVERLVGVIRAWLEEPGADDFDWHGLIRAVIASDREAGYVTVTWEFLQRVIGAVPPLPILMGREIDAAIAAHEQEEPQ